LAFWRMNGEIPLVLPKKVKSRVHPPGLALRRDLLRRAGIPDDISKMKPPKGAGADDLIDALACLVTARHIFEKTARPFPPSPPRDEHGLPMAIWV
jgi:predicted RNase H-like nuclease